MKFSLAILFQCDLSRNLNSDEPEQLGMKMREYVNRVSEPYYGETSEYDGMQLLDFDRNCDVKPNQAPVAYIGLDGKWYERQDGQYPEEVIRNNEYHKAFYAVMREYRGRETEYVGSLTDALDQLLKQYPDPETDWTRQFHAELAKMGDGLVIWYNCHR